MRFRILTLSLFCGLLLSCSPATKVQKTEAIQQDPLVVNTKQGKIKGSMIDEVYVYKGIRYAQPPVGQLRWKAPQEPKSWSGVKECTSFGTICPQAEYSPQSLYYTKLEPMSEDCLYLNVWSKSLTDKKPVMVWIHGGALTRGSGSRAEYDGSQFANNGIVLVSINYRLGAFGFMAHPELSAESPNNASGNYGFLDQIKALEWVKNNISAFGGDPDNVTIFGQSAGSGSTYALTASPLAKGLFHKVIAQSGTMFWPTPMLKEATDTIPSAEHLGLGMMKTFGVTSLAEMRQLPAETIVEKFYGSPLERVIPTAVVDGWFLSERLNEIFENGNQNRVPVLLGSTAKEASALVNPGMFPKSKDEYPSYWEKKYGEKANICMMAYPVDEDSDVINACMDQLGDEWFVLPMRNWARQLTKYNIPAYVYHFEAVTNIPFSNYFGAFHGSEIPFVFQHMTSTRLPDMYSDEDIQLSKVMSSYWINFAKTGNPNAAGLIDWPIYNIQTEPYMSLDKEPKVANQLLKPRLDKLQGILGE